MNVATIGGLIIGNGLLLWQIVTWWPGVSRLRKDPRGCAGDIAPFLFSWCFGALLIMCAGGIFGWLADASVWSGNWLGDEVLIWGVGGEREVVSRGPQQALTNGGHAMVLITLFVWCAVVRRAATDRGSMWRGVWSGSLTGLSNGVLGAAAVPLATFANLAGAWISTEVL